MIRTLLALGVVTGAALASTVASAQCVATEDGSGVYTTTLYAGQTIDAGAVSVEVVGENLQVTYTTTNGWELTEAHLWVDTVLPDSHAPGQFPHNAGDITGLTTYAFDVPLTDLGFACWQEDVLYYVMAHASLRKDTDGDGTYDQEETGWGDGDPFYPDRGNWSMYFTITLTCDCSDDPEDPPDGCETAFAYEDETTSACFSGWGFSRWGWTNGPLAEGTYEFDLYAGAGQCDLWRGTVVGTMTVVYAGGTVTVEYEPYEGYIFLEDHTYAGAGPLPTVSNGKRTTTTVAPGQYAIGTGLTGQIYVIGHAVSCAE